MPSDENENDPGSAKRDELSLAAARAAAAASWIDRRRPGKISDVSPDLIPILRSAEPNDRFEGREHLSADQQNLIHYQNAVRWANDAYSSLSFSQAVSTFSRPALYLALMSFGILAGRLFPGITAAFAQTAAYRPPLGMGQSQFTWVIFIFVMLFAALVLGLFWAGFIAKPKNATAATVVQHLVTFLSGALLGIKT